MSDRSPVRAGGSAGHALPPMHHVGVVVADLDAAALDFEQRWGIGLERHFTGRFEQATYRGQPTKFAARYGFINTGASQIELIQPVSGWSPYVDFLHANGGDGVHHFAYFVEAIDGFLNQLAAAGAVATPALDAQLGSGGRFVYLENVAPGPVIELIETHGLGPRLGATSGT